MNRTLVALLLTLSLCAVARSKQQEQPQKKRPDSVQIDAEIEKLAKKIQDLEKLRHETEQIEERKEEFAEIQEESRERLTDYNEVLEDAKEDDEPSTDERDRYFNALVSHINECSRIDKEIISLKDYRSLAKARTLQDKVEVLDTKWCLVLEQR